MTSVSVKQIKPIQEPIAATITVPGSKSITNRALICASLAQGESTIGNYSDSDDTSLLANGLNQLGVLVRRDDQSLVVEGKGGRVYAPKFPIPVGNAGTTLRFLVTLAALADRGVVFEGSPRMAERPIADLLNALSSLGTEATFEDLFGRYRVKGGSFRGGTAQLRVDRSSQFLSALLMIAPYAKEDVCIEIIGELRSTPYIQMTIDVMRQFGVEVCQEDQRYEVKAGQRYKPNVFEVEADASGASYFWAAAALTNGSVTVRGARLESVQGDIGFLDVLKTMGCRIEESGEGITVIGPDRLKAFDSDMNDMPDLVPTLAVLGLFAKGTTHIRNVSHLQYKESDRLEALHEELQKAGGSITRSDDGLEIGWSTMRDARLDTHEDHRLAMSFALIGLKVPGIVIEGTECVSKSFPNFWEEFDKLYERKH